MADSEIKVELKLLTEKAKAELKKFAEDVKSAMGGGGSDGGGRGGGAGSKEIGVVTTNLNMLNKALYDLIRTVSAVPRSTGGKGGGKRGLWGGSAPDYAPASEIVQQQGLRQIQSLGELNVGGPVGSATKNLFNIIREKIKEQQISTGYSVGHLRDAWAADIKQYRAGGLRGYNLPQKGSSYTGPLPPIMQGSGQGSGQGGGGGNSILGVLNGMLNKQLPGAAATFTKVTAGLAALRVVFGLVGFAVSLALKPLKMLADLTLQMAEGARKSYANALSSGGMPIGFSIKKSAIADVLGVGEREVYQYANAFGRLNNDLQVATNSLAETNPILSQLGQQWKVAQYDMQALGSEIAVTLAPAVTLVVNAIQEWSKWLIWLVKKLRDNPFTNMFYGWEKGMKKLGLMGETPAPMASAHRMQSSPWERMGLVLGASAGDNPAKKTADNTSKMAMLLEQLVALRRENPENSGYAGSVISNKP